MYDGIMKYMPKNIKHMLVAIEYLRTLNLLDSYKSVYGDDVTDVSARSRGSYIMGKDDVQRFMRAYILFDIERLNSGLNPSIVVEGILGIALDSSVDMPTRLRAYEIMGRSLGILGEGRMFEGLEEMRVHYEARLIGEDVSSLSMLGEPKESVDSGGELEDDE